MSSQIEMPELSSDGEGATLATWLVSVGDRVEKGDVIAELETDKATVELEAPQTGTIVELAVVEGAEGILPGTVLGRLDPAEQVSQASAVSADERPPAVVGTDLADLSQDSSETAERLRGATPLARRAALDRDVDLSTVRGSGPGGRVVEEDVLRLADSAAGVGSGAEAVSGDPGAPAFELRRAFESVGLNTMRETIARRMVETKQQVPYFYLRMRCSMDAVLHFRVRLNRGLADEGRDTKISISDFVLRAAGLSLRDVPAANVSFVDNQIHVFDSIDVSVAVETEAGLVAPVVRDVDRKGLANLAAEVKELGLQAREGALRPEQVQGGALTVSDLGMYGIETVYPILIPPQACILGVGVAEEQPVVRDGAIEVGRIATITLAADHRAVDGAVGAQLLAALRQRLEEPLSMML